MQKTLNPLHHAVNLLARREHSEYELKQKLLAKGHDPAEVDNALEALHAKGYLNEKRYAESMLRHHSSRGQGPQKIRYLLTQQQINQALIAEVFSEFEVDWFELAAQARAKRFGLQALPLERTQAFKEQARQMRFLQSRGFEQEQIQYAMDALAQASQEI